METNIIIVKYQIRGFHREEYKENTEPCLSEDGANTKWEASFLKAEKALLFYLMYIGALFIALTQRLGRLAKCSNSYSTINRFTPIQSIPEIRIKYIPVAKFSTSNSILFPLLNLIIASTFSPNTL